MAGVQGVRFHRLFWSTLEPHRDQGYYSQLREKLAWFMERKAESLAPVSGRDNYFRDSGGLWHFAIQRNPDVVVFYTVSGGSSAGATLNLAMVGSHHDYPHAGKNYKAFSRTKERIAHALDEAPMASPLWESLRWDDPSDLLAHPDLSEMAPGALDDVLDELMSEMETGDRYQRRKGQSLFDVGETEFDRYLDDLAAARDLVMTVRTGPKLKRVAETVYAAYR